MMIFSRTAIAKSVRRAMLAGILLVSGWDSLSEAFAQGTAEQASAPLILRSTLENLSRGFIPAGLPPALRIKSGQTVEIETFSHHGFVDDPVAFFKGYGISPEMVLPDLIAVSKNLPRPKDGGTHVLTGPVYINDAEPGDTLEVRILDVKPRVPYGGNGGGPGAVSFRIS